MGALSSLALRSAAGWLSPAGPRARLSILIYHRVRPEWDELDPESPSATEFELQIRALQTHFNVLPLSEAVRRLGSGTLPARAACVTFDDGYADNAEVALPILRRLGVPATFFIATGYLNGGRMFNDTVIGAIRRIASPTLALDDPRIGTLDLSSVVAKRAAIKRILGVWRYLCPTERLARADALGARAKLPSESTLMLRDEQVRELHLAGMEIGAHTATHPMLSAIPITEARAEIASGRRYLESLLQEPVRLFAYPNGRPHLDYGEEHVGLLRDMGFDAAVSTAAGVATSSTDPFQLPRSTPWDRDPFRFSTRLVINLRRRSPDREEQVLQQAGRA